MQEFKIGQTYEFEVIDIRQDLNTGADYLALRDDERDTYRVYNILKFQYEALPEKIEAIVKSVDPFGRPKLKQNTASIYKRIYESGKDYTFKVTDIKQDICSPTKAEYYELEDEWCVHRCYFKEQLHQIGDVCTMKVDGVAENGDYLIITEPEQEKKAKNIKTATPDVIKSHTDTNIPTGPYPIFDLGEESTTLEYKTSIVFNDGRPDIDKQLFVIVKTLAAFMNAEGGDLYIGIHDKTRQLIGISDDLQHLNEGEEDQYNGIYEATIDKYQLKIRHALERLSQGVTEQLVEFEFPVEQGIQYCHIKVKKAKRPIWVRKNLLFQRTGNRITMLEKDEITNFVFERMQVAIHDVVDTDGFGEAAFTPEKIAEVVKLVNNAHRTAVAAPKQAVDPGEVEYYIVWFYDGTWKRLHDASNEKNVFVVLPVKKADKDGRLVFCYASGSVNEVLLSVFIKGSRLNQRVVKTAKQGFNPNEKPLKIFIANDNHFLAVYGADEHGTEYIKVHRVTAINPTQSGGSQGPRIIPSNDRLISCKLVPGDCERKLGKLLYANNKTREVGIPIHSPAYTTEIDFVNNLS